MLLNYHICSVISDLIDGKDLFMVSVISIGYSHSKILGRFSLREFFIFISRLKENPSSRTSKIWLWFFMTSLFTLSSEEIPSCWLLSSTDYDLPHSSIGISASNDKRMPPESLFIRHKRTTKLEFSFNRRSAWSFYSSWTSQCERKLHAIWVLNAIERSEQSRGSSRFRCPDPWVRIDAFR